MAVQWCMITQIAMKFWTQEKHTDDHRLLWTVGDWGMQWQEEKKVGYTWPISGLGWGVVVVFCGDYIYVALQPTLYTHLSTNSIGTFLFL